MEALMYMYFLIDIVRLFLLTLWVILLSFYKMIIPNKSKGLKNEIILVTGGSSGIGKAMCLELVKREKDLTIIVWSINKERNQAIIKELRSLGVKKAIGFLVDVSNAEQVKKGAEKIRKEVGDVTMLFNNAGRKGDLGPGWLINPENAERTFRINMMAHCLTLNEFIPAMIRKGIGHVVTTSSAAGLVYGVAGSVYVASKHGLTSYCECIKEDVRKLPGMDKIYFTTSFPNVTETAFVDGGRVKSINYPFLDSKDCPVAVAKRIIDGVLRNEEHIYFPWYWRFMRMMVGLVPPPIFRKYIDMLGLKYQVDSPM